MAKSVPGLVIAEIDVHRAIQAKPRRGRLIQQLERPDDEIPQGGVAGRIRCGGSEAVTRHRDVQPARAI
jgi:hypothetical protein